MRHLTTATFFALTAALSNGAAAQENAAGSLIVELNRLVPVEGACRLTFLAQNNIEQDVEQIVFETVLFTTEGAVERLTLFDLGQLPLARPRVREFDLPGLACEDLGRVLFNGIEICVGDGLDAETCAGALSPISRVDGVEVIG